MSSDQFISLVWQRPDARSTRAAVHLLGTETAQLGATIRGVNRAAGKATPAGLTLKTDLSGPPSGGPVLSIRDFRWRDGSLNPGRLTRFLSALVDGSEYVVPRLTTGNPVDGADLVGRSRVLLELADKLTQGSVHLMAARRYGKTSLLRQLRSNLLAMERQALLLDLQDIPTAAHLVVHLASEAVAQGVIDPSKAPPLLQGWPPPKSRLLAVMEARERLLAEVAKAVAPSLHQVLSAIADSGVTLLVDEFSLFLRQASLHNEAQVRESMGVARDLRVRAEKPLRWVVSGSSGLRVFIHTRKLDRELGDLLPLQLPPLSESDAATLVEDLFYGNGMPPDEATIAAVLVQVGAPVPYFLQVLVHHVLSEARRHGPLTPELVELAYQQRVLGSEGNEWFRSFQLGQHQYPSEQRRAAEALLSTLARSETPVPAPRMAEIFSTHCPEGSERDRDLLLSCLEEDYDLEPTSDGWRIRSKVLRERWALRESWLTQPSQQP